MLAAMSQFTVVNPATAEPLAQVDRLGADAVDAAVRRAEAAQATWSRLAPADRRRGLERLAAAIDGALDDLAGLESANCGHPIASARAEAAQVRDVFAYYAGGVERLAGAQIPVAGGIDLTFHQPLGLVGIIAPWNFPLPITSWALAPALAAGNAAIVKPAELTPLSALRLADLARAAGLPDGLVQVVTGRGPVVGEALVAHPSVRKLVFTGSTVVGLSIAARAGHQGKSVTLEMGGKSANVVFADADLAQAAAGAPAAGYDNAGQDCCARSRILVEASVYDEFMGLLLDAVAAWRVGDPSGDVDMGPLISDIHRASVARAVEDVPVAGRGTCPDGPGFWFPPLVVTPAEAGHLVMTEEIFGPVLAVYPFHDEAEAYALANATRYGLSGSVWTRSLDRALRAVQAIQSGTLSVNSNTSVRYATPFGGLKASGLGRELGPDAPLAFTETKNAFIAVPNLPGR
jgi:acyl-CoA reductase-like NAD-dependent aldehyde dehydrogenase